MRKNSSASCNSINRRKFRIRFLVELLILVSLLWVLSVTTTRALRKIAVAQIAELTNTRIKTGDVKFTLTGSVSIKQLSIRPEGRAEYDDTILKAQKVHARFRLMSLIMLKPKLKEIRFEDFVFNAQQNLDSGRWNFDGLRLKIGKSGSGKMPAITLRNGKLLCSKVSKAESQIIGAIPVDMSFAFNEENQRGYNFDITTARRPGFSGKSKIKGFWQPGKITFSGGLSSADVPGFERVWMIYVLAGVFEYDQSRNFSIKASIKDMLLKDTFKPTEYKIDLPHFLKKSAFFNYLQKFFDRYQPNGRIDMELWADGNLKSLGKVTLQGTVDCRDVSICDRKFPYSMENLTGRVQFTEKAVSLNNLIAQHKKVYLVLDGQVRDFGANPQYYIQLTSRNMTLDNDLFDALRPKHKKLWSEFSPSGTAAINYCFSRKDGKSSHALAVQLIGVDAVYKKFPYPLKNLTGKIFFAPGKAVLCDVTSQTGSCVIILNGQAVTGQRQPVYDIELKAQNLPLDGRLSLALPADRQQLCRRFDTGGKVRLENLTGRFWSDKEDGGFCYQLLSNNDSQPLSKALFAMLPQPAEDFIRSLNLSGNVKITTELNKKSNALYPDYKITVDCLGGTINYDKFPYPLKDITGKITIEEDTILLTDMTAKTSDNIHITSQPPTIKAEGRVTLADRAFNTGKFKLTANDIFFDQRLAIALSENFGDSYQKLSPTGRFDIDLEDIHIFSGGEDEKYIDFVGNIGLKDCGFETKSEITDLHAALKTKGTYKIGDGFCKADAHFEAETLRIKGKSLTDVTADINYDNQLRQWSTENLVASSYDGLITGKFQLQKTQQQNYSYIFQAAFDDIDLKKFLVDTKDKIRDANSYSTGKMCGAINIAGRTEKSSSRLGTLAVKITDMKVGKLSPLARLLYALKLTDLGDFAFSRLLIDSYITGDNLHFEKFDLSGDNIAFSGSGDMNMVNGALDLKLMARGRRLATEKPSILQSLTEGLGRAVVRMEITGNINDPQVDTYKLPVIRDTIELLGIRIGKPARK